MSHYKCSVCKKNVEPDEFNGFNFTPIKWFDVERIKGSKSEFAKKLLVAPQVEDRLELCDSCFDSSKKFWLIEQQETDVNRKIDFIESTVGSDIIKPEDDINDE